MLILTRRIGDSLFIGDDIKITVLEASGRQVKLGIKAPHDVAVHREEIYHRIKREEARQNYSAKSNISNERHSSEDNKFIGELTKRST